MAKEDKYSLVDFHKDFPNDAACIELIFGALHNRKCSCGGTYNPMFKMVENELVGRRQYQCSKCRYQIAPTAGTIFHKSDSQLTLWFHAIWIFSNAKSGISAKEMERQLGVTYKTAWRMLHMIRKALKQKGTQLGGDVEMDETYFGGKGNSGPNNRDHSKVLKQKSVIIGAIERKGRTRAKVSPNGKASTIATFLDQNIDPMETRLLTDDSNRYKKSAWGYEREIVNHSQKEWARGDVHTNTIESFWSHFKRSVTGTHKAISKKYLQEYLNGFVWHRDNRHNDNQRFVTLLDTLLHA